MLILIFVVIVALWYVQYRFTRRRMYEVASLYKGPKEYPFIGSAHKLVGTNEDMMKTLKDLAYDSIKNKGIIKLWLGPKLYFVMVHPTDSEFVLKNCLDRDEGHKFVRQLLGSTSNPSVAFWKEDRKLNANIFAPKIIENFLQIFNDQSKKLLMQLSKYEGVTFKFWPLVNKYSFDSVYEAITGDKREDEDNNECLLDLINRSLQIISQRMLNIWLQPDWLFRLFTMYKEQEKCVKTGQSIVNEVIINKRSLLRDNTETKLNKNISILELLLKIHADESIYSNDILREKILKFITVGTDTTAVSIGYLLKSLAMHPDVQEKVHQELLDVFGNSDRHVTVEDIQKLTYLDLVFKESLRILPPAHSIARRIVRETTLPSGRILPANCGVIISIWGAHRDPTYWGDDAETFRPERFSPETFKQKHACSFMPFSITPKKCIGYHFANVSIKTVAATILRKYKVFTIQETTPFAQLPGKFDFVMKSADDFLLALEKRN